LFIEDGALCCSVRDNGVGFDVGSVAEWRGSRHLGLRLIEDRLVVVGGTLVIVSAPGQGTELRAAIPIVEA
jgi:signal transduction histidine kinase